jgi:serine protease Do
MDDVTPDKAKKFDLKKAQGVIVTVVLDDSPADKAGLEAGDVITELNGEDVKKPTTFRNTIAMMPPGTEINLTINRDGKIKKIKVTLGTLDDAMALAQTEEAADLGIKIQDLTEDIAKKFGYETGRGVLITSVDPGSNAQHVGLVPGIIILSVDRKPVNSVKEFNTQLKKIREDGDDEVMLFVKGERIPPQYVIVRFGK